MPAAQKRGSSPAPGMFCAKSFEKVPKTVEMLTPTFSKTRPCMTDIVPPPASVPASAFRFQVLRSKRPGLRSARGPASSSSIFSNSEQMRLRSSSNQPAARGFCSVAMSMFIVLGPLNWASGAGLAEGFAEDHSGSDRDVQRAHVRLPSECELRPTAAAATSGVTPALSRPKSSVSSRRDIRTAYRFALLWS